MKKLSEMEQKQLRLLNLKFARDPIFFIEKCFDIELTSHQKEYCNSLKQFIWERLYSHKLHEKKITEKMVPQEYKKMETTDLYGFSVSSGRGTGKTSIIALTSFWLLKYFDSKICIYEPSESSIRTILAAEVSDWLDKYDNDKECFVFPYRDEFTSGSEGLKYKSETRRSFSSYRVIQKNATMAQTKAAYSGMHNEKGPMIFIFDEAIAYEEYVYKDVTKGLDTHCGFIINTYNPVQDSYATRSVWGTTEEKQMWRGMVWNFEDSERCTDKHIERAIKDCLGKNNPEYRSNIQGIYDVDNDKVLIPSSLIESSVKENNIEMPIHMSCDVSGGGVDNTIVCVFRGYHLIDIIKIDSRDRESIFYQLSELIHENAPKRFVIDSCGEGGPVYERLRATFNANLIKGINVSTKSSNNKKYPRLRDEGYWNLKNLFEQELISIEPFTDGILRQYYLQMKNEISIINYDRDASGRLKIEEKRSIKKKLGHSPDFADAFMLGFCNNLLLSPDSVIDAMTINMDAKQKRKLRMKRERILSGYDPYDEEDHVDVRGFERSDSWMGI